MCSINVLSGLHMKYWVTLKLVTRITFQGEIFMKYYYSFQQEKSLQVSENKVIRIIFRPKKEDVNNLGYHKELCICTRLLG
jgi:hypothetical protein